MIRRNKLFKNRHTLTNRQEKIVDECLMKFRLQRQILINDNRNINSATLKEIATTLLLTNDDANSDKYSNMNDAFHYMDSVDSGTDFIYCSDHERLMFTIMDAIRNELCETPSELSEMLNENLDHYDYDHIIQDLYDADILIDESCIICPNCRLIMFLF